MWKQVFPRLSSSHGVCSTDSSKKGFWVDAHVHWCQKMHPVAFCLLSVAADMAAAQGDTRKRRGNVTLCIQK